MIVHLAPGAPPVFHVVARAMLYSHIAAGVVGLLSGAAVLTARKGGWLHRGSGTVFAVAIMIMGAIGAPTSARPGDARRLITLREDGRCRSVSVQNGSTTCGEPTCR